MKLFKIFSYISMSSVLGWRFRLLTEFIFGAIIFFTIQPYWDGGKNISLRFVKRFLFRLIRSRWTKLQIIVMCLCFFRLYTRYYDVLTIYHLYTNRSQRPCRRSSIVPGGDLYFTRISLRNTNTVFGVPSKVNCYRV